jgi:predicted phosphodiesterase
VGLISDIHANALALEAALTRLRRENVDEIVVMGDLFTYGCHVRETTELLRALERSERTTFLLGNHDQLYVELQRTDHTGKRYYDGLPGWIQESARWTASQLGNLHVDRLFNWCEEHVVNGVLFSHANPFGARDWTYLTKGPELARAARSVAARGLRAGVFGHTHRAMSTRDEGVMLFNPGSVGQPRDMRKTSTAAVLDVETLKWQEFDVTYDERAHCEAVASSALSDATKRQILKFHTTEGR